MAWFPSMAAGTSRLAAGGWFDYLAGPLEDFEQALRPAGEASPAEAAGPAPVELSGPVRRGVLACGLLAVLALFSWNYHEFFSPDAVYYFGRRVDSLQRLTDAFSGLDDRGHYRPLGLVLFTYLLYPLFGTNPVGYHFIPLLFHGANTLLAYSIARRLLNRPSAALGAALFFALHRINFFVTFGITFIPDFTGVFFLLSALLCYLKRAQGRRWYWLSLLCFVCAVLSKEAAVVLPAILTGLELSRRRAVAGPLVARLKATGPYWAAAAVFLAALVVFHGGSLYPASAGHPYAVSASPQALLAKLKYLWWSLNLPQGSRVTSLFGGMLELSDAVVRTGYPVHTSLAALVMAPFVLAFLAFLFRSFRRGDRTILFAAFFFAAALAPVVPLAGRVMHHNLYFPLLGIALAFGAFVDFLFRERRALMLMILPVAFLFSTATGVINNRHDSWPVTSSRRAARYLEQFHSVLPASPGCEGATVIVSRTGDPDFAWYTDGGNLFRVFSSCASLKIYLEDLQPFELPGAESDDVSSVIRIDVPWGS